MVDGAGGGSASGGGISSSDLAGLATQVWVNQNYLSIDFFSSLFKAYGPAETEGDPDVEIVPNDTESTISNIKAMFGFWTEQYISALGQGSGGGGGGGATTLGDLLDVEFSGTPSDGQVLKYNGTTHKWYNGTDEGVTSLAWSQITDKPTTLAGYGITDAYTKTEADAKYLTSSSFSAFTTSSLNISATIGATTRTVQAPTIAYLGNNDEAASSATTPSSKFVGTKFGASSGFYMTGVYPSGSSPADIPCSYGNILNILGGGGGQLLAEWCNTYKTGRLYYRSHRDYLATGGWTPWEKIAFISDFSSWALAANKPSYAFSEITGKIAANQLPDLSGTYAAAGRVTALEGYFTDGVANNAARLSTVSKTAWGQTYWTANGVPDSVSGSIEAGNSGGSIEGFHRIELNTHGTLSDYGGVIDFHFNGSSSDYTSRIIEDASGTLSVNSVEMWSGYVKATRFYLSNSVYFQLDSNGDVQLVGAGLWTNSFISALGQGSGGGGGGATALTDLTDVEFSGTPSDGQVLKYNGTTHKWYNGTDGQGDVTWTALVDNSDNRQIASSHITDLLGGTFTGKNYAVQRDANGKLYVNVPWANTTYGADNGVGLSGTTFYNSGVRSTTINGNYLRVNTNGTNADLTIPYATNAGTALVGNKLNVIATISGQDTANYPWRLIARSAEITTNYVDTEAVIVLRQFSVGGRTGIIKIAFRTNEIATTASGVSAVWLDRFGFNVDDIKIAVYWVANKSYADVFVKATAWNRMELHVIGNRSWSFVSSSEGVGGANPVNAYASIEAAATTIHGRAYTNIVNAQDGGIVSYANSAGSAPASDVYAWAKAASKPSYSFSELTSHPTTLSGYGITDAYISSGTIYLGGNSITPLTSFTETDPTVPAWAKASTKPSYAFSELTGTVAFSQLPTMYWADVAVSNSSNNNTSPQFGNLRLRPGSGNYGSYLRFGDGDYAYIAELSDNHLTYRAGSHTFNVSSNEAVQINSSGLRIGGSSGVVLSWDSTNNALKVQKADGTAANFYATGGVSALGLSSGSSGSISNLRVTGTLNIGSSFASLYCNSNNYLYVDAPRIYFNSTLYTGSNNIRTESGNIYTEEGNIYLGGGYIYLDSSRYIYLDGSTLKFYDGSTAKTIYTY